MGSIAAENNLGEIGSPCLTPLFIWNFSDNKSSMCILAVAFLYIFSRICTYVSLMLIFRSASNIAKCSTESKAFSSSKKPTHSGRLYSFVFSEPNNRNNRMPCTLYYYN